MKANPLNGSGQQQRGPRSCLSVVYAVIVQGFQNTPRSNSNAQSTTQRGKNQMRDVRERGALSGGTCLTGPPEVKMGTIRTLTAKSKTLTNDSKRQPHTTTHTTGDNGIRSVRARPASRHERYTWGLDTTISIPPTTNVFGRKVYMTIYADWELKGRSCMEGGEDG